MSEETYTPIINEGRRIKVKDYSDIYVPDRDLRKFIVTACNSFDNFIVLLHNAHNAIITGEKRDETAKEIQEALSMLQENET